jgi:hypothetical protein
MELGNLYFDVKGKSQAEALRSEEINTDAKYRGGAMRSSEEVSVMEVERRHGIVQSG